MNHVRFCLLMLTLSLTGCVHVARHSHTELSSTSYSGPSRPADQWASENRLTLTYRVQGRDAVLDSERVTLLFTDLPVGVPDTFSFQHGRLDLQVGGGGVSEAKVECSHNRHSAIFQARYEHGTNNIEFFGRQLKLVNQGRRIITRDGSFDISTNAPKPTISIR